MKNLLYGSCLVLPALLLPHDPALGQDVQQKKTPTTEQTDDPQQRDSLKATIEDHSENSFSLVQYVDLQGFNNDKPNGILQQQIQFDWVLNKKLYFIEDDHSHFGFQLLPSVTFPYILFNRIDKSKDFTNYPVGQTLAGNNDTVMRPYLTTLDIWKYSSFQGGFKVNLAALRTKQFLLQLNYGLLLVRNNPFYADTIRFGADSGKTAGDMRAVYSFAHRIELRGQSLLASDKLNIGFSAGIMFLNLKDSYYRQFDAGAVDAFNRTTVLLPADDAVNNRLPRPIYYVTGALEKRWGEKDANAEFFRVNYSFQPGSYTQVVSAPGQTTVREEQKRFYNHYLQLQVGVSFGLEALFNRGQAAKKDEAATEADEPKEEPSFQQIMLHLD